MYKEIDTFYGTYKYRPIPLYYGRKIIDREVAKCNLLDFKKLLDSNEVPFGIIYGTLLGAVREKNFIEYDEDVDVFILDENREKFIALLFDFKELGFEVARYENDLMSLIRNNDYIDIYFFKKGFGGRRTCNQDSLSTNFLDTFNQVMFLGVEFNTPNNYIAFLEKAYGKDWMIPKRNTPANVINTSIKLKKLLIKLLPRGVISFLKIIKKKVIKVG